MKKYFVNTETKDKIPELVNTSEFAKNAWISPKGVFYGFDHAKHVLVARYITIFVLNKDHSVLKKGTYFSEDFDSYLLKNGWLSVKDVSWFYDKIENPEGKIKLHSRNELTQKQQNTMFDYSNSLNLDYNKLINKKGIEWNND